MQIIIWGQHLQRTICLQLRLYTLYYTWHVHDSQQLQNTCLGQPLSTTYCILSSSLCRIHKFCKFCASINRSFFAHHIQTGRRIQMARAAGYVMGGVNIINVLMSHCKHHRCLKWSVCMFYFWKIKKGFYTVTLSRTRQSRAFVYPCADLWHY